MTATPTAADRIDLPGGYYFAFDRDFAGFLLRAPNGTRLPPAPFKSWSEIHARAFVAALSAPREAALRERIQALEGALRLARPFVCQEWCEVGDDADMALDRIDAAFVSTPSPKDQP